MITDYTGNWDVAWFLMHQLERFDTSKLDWFKLLDGVTKSKHSGLCTYPKRLRKGSTKFKHGYRVRCSINPNLTYPVYLNLNVGTWRKAMATGGVHWGYETALVRFADAQEHLVWLAGHEAFHFLRHSRQIPGRNTEPSANRFGLDWLKLWRDEACKP